MLLNITLILTFLRMTCLHHCFFNCCKKCCVEMIRDKSNEYLEIGDTLPIKSLYKAYIIKKMEYRRYIKSQVEGPHLKHYFVKSLEHMRDALKTRIRMLLNQEFKDIDREFDKKIDVIIKKLNVKEIPIIKHDYYYRFCVRNFYLSIY